MLVLIVTAAIHLNNFLKEINFVRYVVIFIIVSHDDFRTVTSVRYLVNYGKFN